MPNAKNIAVIGAGWAGCAAAVELTGLGHRVSLFEAARTPGGRARQVLLDERRLDNGQHILLGAYRESLRLMKRVGIDHKRALLSLPLQMRYPPGDDGMNFVAGPWPAPWHLLTALLRADGLQGADKLALARFTTSARWMGWQLHVDCSVQELLERFDQTARLIQLMWRPLCIAALNTPPERASAQVFLAVLRDSLGAGRAASDMLIPRVDLGALLPEAAARFLAQSGAQLHFGTQVKAISANTKGFDIAYGSGLAAFDAVVLATQAKPAARLLQDLVDVSRLDALEYEAITTCYLQYPAELRLAQPLFALVDNASKSEWAQFVFDRGHLDPAQAGLLAAVVSSSGQAAASGHEQLTAAVMQQLARAFAMPQLKAPLWSKVITEKRASFACTPALDRPDNPSGVDNLVLAGDYTLSDYPGTLESAVRSGLKAAGLLHQQLDRQAR